MSASQLNHLNNAAVRHKSRVLKVIPLKLFYYQTFFKWLDNCNVFIQYPGHAVRGDKGGLDETN